MAPEPHEALAGHAVSLQWRGGTVVTLEDLLRQGLRAVSVGINPSPVSVKAGHYYQGRAGQRFFGRLRAVGVLPDSSPGAEDDAAFAAGIGFTDIVKRPSANAKSLTTDEFEHGRRELEAKLEHYGPKLVIFVFKQTAEVLFGRFAGNGFVPGLTLATAKCS